MIFSLFADPKWLLICLVSLVALGLLFFASERHAWKRLKRFAAPGLIERLTASHSRRRLWIKNSLMALVVLLAFAALSRPQWGANWEKAETKGIDVMIALDTSRSMLAEDIAPNRLERSKLAILDLLKTVKGDRVGLIAFAGNAFLQCPLTLDYQAFRQTLAAISTETIPVGGTDLAAAIDEADAYFEQTNNERILILITDGEDLEASGLQRALAVAEKGTRILTVGVGSIEGELIPIRTPDGQQDFLRDSSGKPVSSSLDESTLKRIARATNGLYAPLGPTGSGLERVYEFSLAQMPAQDRKESLQRIPIERFQWPLVVALVLLAIESLLSTRRRKLASTGAQLMISGLIPLSMAILPNSSEAGSAIEASKAYEEERYEESMSLYRDALLEEPDKADYLYNLGVSAYRSGRFEEAISSFEKTLKVAKPVLQTKAFYNLGNSRVAYGFNRLEEQPSLTRDLWIAAQTDFENALSLKETHAPSIQNLQQIKDTLEAFTYNLETSADPIEAGTVTLGGPSFHRIPFPLKAEAADGWLFTEWTGEGIESPDKARTVILLEADALATAHFVKTWDLTVLSDDETMGTAGTSGTYREDEPVPVKAEALDYYAFSEWISDTCEFADPSMAETEVTLTQDAEATAVFVPAFNLTITLDPEIGGKAGPSGFFEEYSVVQIQAEPRPGFEWLNWEGDGVKEPELQQSSIPMIGDREAVAKMKRVWNLVIIPNPEEGGTVTGAGNHPLGSTVDISAQPMEGFTFEGWEGPGVADPESLETTVTVASTEHTLFAHFKQDDQDGEDNQDNQDEQQDQEDQQNQNQDDQQDQQDNEEQDQDQQDEEESPPEEEEEEEPQQPDEESPEENEPEEQEDQESDSQEQPAQPDPTEVGTMTPDEARQLLNALSESEQFLPAGEISQEKAQQDEPSSGKDW